jgi:hypothetical protein
VETIQNLESCQLDDLPTILRVDFVATRRGNKNEPQHVPEFGTATIHLVQSRRLSPLRQPACKGFPELFFSSFEPIATISPAAVSRNSVSPQVILFEKKLPSHTTK